MSSVSADLVVNQKHMAKVLGLTTRQIRNLDEDGMPSTVISSGERIYDLTVTVPWYLARKLEHARNDSDELDQAKLERAQLDVRLRQIDVAKAEGSAIDIEHHDEVVEELVRAFRLSVLALPGTWGPRIVGITDPAQGTEAMRRCADDLLRAMQSKAGDLELEAARETATPLPEDFPGYRALSAVGVKTFDDLRMLGDPRSVKGIGPKTASQIAETLESAA